MSFFWLSAVLTAAGILLSGCASSPGGSRYILDQDRAPSGSIDVSSLEDARPRYEAPQQAGNRSPYTVWGRTYHVLESNDGYVARGIASWYGEKFHGYRTSNGEIFDMYRMTAAHKSLRIPSYARVTNLENGRSVIVRVNDRGPFHSDRLIDLSYAAAVKLGFHGKGTAPVEVAAITVHPDGSMYLAGRPFVPSAPATTDTPVRVAGQEQPAPEQEQGLFVQLGSFSSRDPAEALVGRVRAVVDNPARVRAFDSGMGVFHRVQVGPFNSEADAREIQALLESHGFTQTILLTDSR